MSMMTHCEPEDGEDLPDEEPADETLHLELLQRVDALKGAIDCRCMALRRLARTPTSPAEVEHATLQRVVRFLEAEDEAPNLNPQPWEPCA